MTSEEISKTPILRYFEYRHLPGILMAISKPCSDLAMTMAQALPASAETTAGLRKLLEAKDCFVQAALITIVGPPDQITIVGPPEVSRT